MKLIAESGSTKCDWVLVDEKSREIDRWKTIGFNPYFHSSESILEALKKSEGLKVWADRVEKLWFYGAGCSTEPYKEIVRNALNQMFPNANNHVGHDLQAAAHALYTGEPLIACILGTGSNSCYFDGEHLENGNPSLGYILGDEGSAGYIGKRIVSDFLYHRLPDPLQKDFAKIYKINTDDVTKAVYDQPHANVYLAGFGPFAGKWSDHEYIQKIVKQGFHDFLDIHVTYYEESKTSPISFVGSVAKIYEDLLSECLKERNLRKGRVLAKPVNQLVEYHLRK